MAKPGARQEEEEALIGAPQLSVVDGPSRKAMFAGLDHEVASALGNRAAAAIYGYFATFWYEHASPEKLAAIKRATGRMIVPGDWVSISYGELMQFTSTTSKGSIVRWIRVLTEEEHRCPWGRCRDRHPLVVVKRVGRGQNNKYRRWRCGEDTLYVRPRIRSEKLHQHAYARRHPDFTILTCLPLEEVPSQDFRATETCTEPCEVSPQDLRTESRDGTCASPPSRLLMEVSLEGLKKSRDETCLREKTLEKQNVSKRVAAKEEVDDEESSDVAAVASEAVSLIWRLGRSSDPNYQIELAREVAMRLAEATLDLASGNPERARSILVSAVADARVTSAERPIGMLRRGILGKRGDGTDRFLVNLKTLRRGDGNQAIKREEEAAAENMRRDDISLDNEAAAYLESLSDVEREALEQRVALKLGSIAGRRSLLSGSILRRMVIVEIRRQLSRSADG